MMRATLLLLALSSPAAASPDWRIFPSLPDAYRSGTVPLHFAAFSDGTQGNGYGGSFGSGHNPSHGGGGKDGYGLGRTAVSKTSSERTSVGGNVGSGSGWGGTATGPGGLRGGGV